MNWMELYQVLLWPVLGIVLILFGYLLTRLVRWVNTAQKNQEFTHWYNLAYTLVTSAEGRFEGKAGEDKFNYVAGRLQEYLPSLTSTQIRDLIESAVKIMRDAAAKLPVPAQELQTEGPVGEGVSVGPPSMPPVLSIGSRLVVGPAAPLDPREPRPLSAREGGGENE